MSRYQIKRWDGVMFGNSITKMPMIYIEPDVKFLEFIKANNYAVMCKIVGTGMVYDEVLIPGVVDNSCDIPNCRPNFCAQTGYYVITLMGTWNGYPNPNNLGDVIISGLYDTNEIPSISALSNTSCGLKDELSNIDFVITDDINKKGKNIRKGKLNNVVKKKGKNTGNMNKRMVEANSLLVPSFLADKVEIMDTDYDVIFISITFFLMLVTYFLKESGWLKTSAVMGLLTVFSGLIGLTSFFVYNN
jgi:hypothetical protein